MWAVIVQESIVLPVIVLAVIELSVIVQATKSLINSFVDQKGGPC